MSAPAITLRLGSLDTKVLVVSIAAAVLLAALRYFSRKPSPNGQLFYDMLGVWTVIELGLIVAADLDPSVTRMPDLNVVDLIRSNGALLPFALLYCGWIVATSTLAPTIILLKAKDKPGVPGA